MEERRRGDSFLHEGGNRTIKENNFQVLDIVSNKKKVTK